ncbi:hypothetical protein EV401DRAFT_217110 [Pisolithus croceorrhizus]|nr:hypothetical protein EV401DRAFT_217110 [Pisolithus croceorrhizus]
MPFQLLTAVRCYTTPITIPLFDDHPPMGRGDVVEIQGPASSGKTHLLYQLLLYFMLPWAKSGSPLSSLADQGTSAIIYDLDSSFDVLRFRCLLAKRISCLFPIFGTTEHAELVQASLRRLHIFRPKSLSQLAASLKYLPSYHTTRMPGNEIGFLAIDSISTYYWLERLREEQDHHFVPEKVKNRSDTLCNVLTVLGDVIQTYSPVVVLTNWGLHAVAQAHHSHGSAVLYKQHLRHFPMLQNMSSFGARSALENYDKSIISRPIVLAHHISLSCPTTSLPSARGNLVSREEFRDKEETMEKGRKVVGLITSSLAQGSRPFEFLISGDALTQKLQADS